MKSRILKRVLYTLLIIVGAFALLMLMPRAYGVLYPKKPPVGYHFLWTSYLAVGLGLEEIIDTTPEVPENIEAIKDIEYKNVDGRGIQLDLYKPKNITEPAPLLIFVHGGGWVKGRRADMLPLVIEFTQLGYITATVSYRLGRYPHGAEDVSDAVDWFFGHSDAYGYDPNRIALVGASAGAHLAMLAAYGWGKENTKDSTDNIRRLRAVINIFGPVDMTTDFARHHPMANAFIGQSYEDAPALYKEASPVQYVDAGAPPTMIIQGTSDELVPNDQADILKAKLDSAGVPCHDHRYPLWPHAMILVQRVYDHCIPQMVSFLDEYVLFNSTLRQVPCKY